MKYRFKLILIIIIIYMKNKVIEIKTNFICELQLKRILIDEQHHSIYCYVFCYAIRNHNI